MKIVTSRGNVFEVILEFNDKMPEGHCYYEIYNGKLPELLDQGEVPAKNFEEAEVEVRKIAERPEGSPETDAETITPWDAINKWFYFAMNYPENFIESVWGERSLHSLSDHLEGKFDALYDAYGSRAVMMAFYAELDGGNREKLLHWVLENYNDECKLKRH